MPRTPTPLLLAIASLVLLAGAACGSRQHIPLDAPQYEDPVAPAGASDGGAPTPVAPR